VIKYCTDKIIFAVGQEYYFYVKNLNFNRFFLFSFTLEVCMFGQLKTKYPWSQKNILDVKKTNFEPRKK